MTTLRSRPRATTLRVGRGRWCGVAPIVIATTATAASCRSSSTEPPARRTAPSAVASAPAPRKASVPSLPAPPPPPIVAPGVPPQLLVCGQREFYRITKKSLDTFEVARTPPPPQIRGSRVATQTGGVAVADALSVFSWSERQVVVIAKNGVVRHRFGEKAATWLAPVDATAPLFAWRDSKPAASFWVRRPGEASLRRYSLGDLGPARPEPHPPVGKSPQHVEPLPEFDSKLLAVLADGAPLYSTPNGLRRLSASAPTKLPSMPAPLAGLFADSEPGRYWALDAEGNLGRIDPHGDAPSVAAKVQGVVVAVDHDGERVAVLSLDADAARYRPRVTIFRDGKQEGQVTVGPTPVRFGQPELDLCLIPGRPWVVVGGRYWLQLLDWSTPRLLAEW